MRSSICFTLALFATFLVAAPAPQVGYIDTVINSTLSTEQKPTITDATTTSYLGRYFCHLVQQNAHNTDPFCSLNDSQGQTFYFTVRAEDPRYDGHNLQLMPGDPASLAVVDLASPALLLVLQNGSLSSAGLNDYNREYSDF